MTSEQKLGAFLKVCAVVAFLLGMAIQICYCFLSLSLDGWIYSWFVSYLFSFACALTFLYGIGLCKADRYIQQLRRYWCCRRILYFLSHIPLIGLSRIYQLASKLETYPCSPVIAKRGTGTALSAARTCIWQILFYNFGIAKVGAVFAHVVVKENWYGLDMYMYSYVAVVLAAFVALINFEGLYLVLKLECDFYEFDKTGRSKSCITDAKLLMFYCPLLGFLWGIYLLTKIQNAELESKRP